MKTLALLLFPILALAAGNQESNKALWPMGDVIPQVIFGGEWKTTVYLLNDKEEPAVVTISFFRAGRDPKDESDPFPIAGMGTAADQKVTIQPGGHVYVVIAANSEETVYGYGIVESRKPDGSYQGGVVGYVFLRNHTPARPQDFEISYGFQSSYDEAYVMPFDQGNYGQVVLTLVNARGIASWPRDPVSVIARIRDGDGSVIWEKIFSLKPDETSIINFAKLDKATWNVEGTLTLSGTGSFTATALRINDSGSFTAVTPFDMRLE